MLRVTNLLLQLLPDLINVDGIVAQKHFLFFVDADHQPLFGDLFNGAGLWHRDLDARLQHRRRHHKDDQEDEDHVHERSYVDIGESDLGAAIRSGERHYRRTSSGIRKAVGWRSTALAISSEKSSQRAAKSRIDPPIKL